jgi:hypothetical protein
LETAEALMGMLFNAALVIMIVATMFAAGLTITLSDLGGVVAIIFIQIIISVFAASYLGKGQPEPEDNLANDQTSETQPAT